MVVVEDPEFLIKTPHDCAEIHNIQAMSSQIGLKPLSSVGMFSLTNNMISPSAYKY